MPKMLKIFANGMRKVRKVYADLQSGMSKLEKEVDLVSGDQSSSKWQDYLPEGIQRLPSDFQPGQMSADEYKAVRAAYQDEVDKAKAKFEQAQSTEEQQSRP
jgi:hypothetical protein